MSCVLSGRNHTRTMLSRNVFKIIRVAKNVHVTGLHLRPSIGRCLGQQFLGNRTLHASTIKPNEAEKGQSHKLGSLRVDKPMLMIAFTCKRCDTRSSHTMSKQAYSKGTVLIQCPGCKNRHLIADHLKIFNDDHITIEDIMRAKGESVSLTTDDLAFEDVPESLKNVIGHYATDAPENIKKKLNNEKVHHLPTPKD